MCNVFLMSAFAVGLLAQLGPSFGHWDATCAGESCHSDKHDDPVAMLQLSTEIAHPQAARESHVPVRKVHMSSGVPQLAVLQANASEQQALHAQARAVKQQVQQADDVSSAKRPPPNIMLVLLVGVVLCFATTVFYYSGIMLTAASEHAKDYELAIDMVACFAGIIICFCSYGIAQEYIITQDYDGDKFPSVPFLILSNRIFIVCVAIALLIAKGETLLWKPSLCTVFPGASGMISSWCQYECLHYVTFPTQVVFKSAKIVPTMLMNMIVNGKFAPFWDYVQAIIITSCVVGFSLLTEKAKGSEAQSNTFTGIIMLSAFLLGDALTSNGEKKIYDTWKEPPEKFSNTQMMLAMGIVGLIYSGVTAAFSNGGYPVMFAFISKHPGCLTQMLALSICSMSGQYLIYYIVQKHGPVIMAIMMTVRQILSIFVSAALYGHDIPLPATLLAVVCFAVVLAKPIHKWMTKEPESLDAAKNPSKPTI